MYNSEGEAPVIRPKVRIEIGKLLGYRLGTVTFVSNVNALLGKVKSTARNVTTCQVCSLSKGFG